MVIILHYILLLTILFLIHYDRINQNNQYYLFSFKINQYEIYHKLYAAKLIFFPFERV